MSRGPFKKSKKEEEKKKSEEFINRKQKVILVTTVFFFRVIIITIWSSGLLTERQCNCWFYVDHYEHHFGGFHVYDQEEEWYISIFGQCLVKTRELFHSISNSGTVRALEKFVLNLEALPGVAAASLYLHMKKVFHERI